MPSEGQMTNRPLPSDLGSQTQARLSENARQFFNESAASWLFNLAVMQFMLPGERHPSPSVCELPLSECCQRCFHVCEGWFSWGMAPTRCDPCHFDGGASVLLMTMTLRGHRDVVLFADPEKSSNMTRAGTLDARAGTLYMATMCSALHEVRHTKDGIGASTQLH